MRKLMLNECYFYKKVTYTLIAHTKMGIEVESIMEGGNKVQFFHPSSWRRFKKWVK